MEPMQQTYSYGGAPFSRYGAIRDEEKRQLRRQSIRAGLCLIAFALIREGFVLLLRAVPGLVDLYLENPPVADAVETVIYVCSLFLPFLVAYRLMPPGERDVCYIFDKPVSAISAVAAVVACFFFCTLGDYATNYLLEFVEKLGFEVGGGTYEVPTNGMELISSLFQIAFLPALIEEYALRCVVLQPMRRFGDRYAIVMSAFVFAIMHGNLVQIPFAFIAGIAFGYYVAATGSIWVGVAAHCVNNVYSVILNYLVETRPTTADTVYQLLLSITLVGGILCVVLFWKVLPHHKMRKSTTILTGSEKTAVYIFTVPMVLAILYMVVQTALLIQYVGVS